MTGPTTALRLSAIWKRAEGRLLAVTSHSGAQVGSRKPVIQGGPAGEILSWSPGSGYGRLPEVTNGFFVEAKHEKPALSIGQLWRNPKGGSGSGVPVRAAGKQSSEQRVRPAVTRGQLHLV